MEFVKGVLKLPQKYKINFRSKCKNIGCHDCHSTNLTVLLFRKLTKGKILGKMVIQHTFLYEYKYPHHVEVGGNAWGPDGLFSYHYFHFALCVS